MIALLLADVLMIQEPASLSPEARALIAPVAEAIAADYEFTLVTLDKRMAKGARAVGLDVVELPTAAQ